MENKKIYQILTGKSEDEYYTYVLPKFKDDEFLICKDVIVKKTVGRKVVDKLISADYSSDVINEQSFSLVDGVVLKCFDSEALDWVNRNQFEAEEQLKERELEVYREIIPKLLARQQGQVINYPISDTTVQQSQGTKNLFID